MVFKFSPDLFGEKIITLALLSHVRPAAILTSEKGVYT